MATFRVKIDWFGYVPGTHYLIVQVANYKRFMTTEYVYDLVVTHTEVDLAGPGTDSIDDTGDEVITEDAFFVWFSLSEIAERFDGRAEGWRTQKITCGGDEQRADRRGESEIARQNERGEGASRDEQAGSTGIEVRFKGHIDSGTIASTQAAPTAKFTIQGQELTLPTGASVTQTTGGMAKDALGKYQLCPDGAGDYTVAEIEQVPASDTVFHEVSMKLKWKHEK